MGLKLAAESAEDAEDAEESNSRMRISDGAKRDAREDRYQTAPRTSDWGLGNKESYARVASWVIK